MNLNTFKCILMKVNPKEKMGDKPDAGTKQTVLLKIPERTIDNGFDEPRKIKEELFEADVMNGKIPEDVLSRLLGKKIEVQKSFLNGYEYKKKDASGKETGEIAYGKSITLAAIAEVKEGAK